MGKYRFAEPRRLPGTDAETLAWILAAGAATGVGGLALLVVRDRPSAPSTAWSAAVPWVILGFAVGGVVLLVLDPLRLVLGS